MKLGCALALYMFLLAGCSSRQLFGKMKPGALAVFSPAMEVAFPEDNGKLRIIKLSADFGNNESFAGWAAGNIPAISYRKADYKLRLINEAFKIREKIGVIPSNVIVGSDYVINSGDLSKGGEWFVDLRQFQYADDGSRFVFSTTEIAFTETKAVSTNNLVVGSVSDWPEIFSITLKNWIENPHPAAK